MAAAVIASAATEAEQITMDPDRLLQSQQAVPSREPGDTALEATLNPERIAPVMRRLIGYGSDTRVRVYDRDGLLLTDSRTIAEAVRDGQKGDNPMAAFWRRILSLFVFTDLPLYQEIGAANGKSYAEVRLALMSQATSALRRAAESKKRRRAT